MPHARADVQKGGNALSGQVEEPITQCEKLFSVACAFCHCLHQSA
jgi:hypothetical protein